MIKKRKRTDEQKRGQGGTPKPKIEEEKEQIVKLKTPKMRKRFERSKE